MIGKSTHRRWKEKGGQRLKAVLPSGAESASGSAGDMDALRMVCVTGRTE